MNLISRTYELFYYDGTAESNGETDFCGGTAIFNTGERVAFLREYAKLASGWFDDAELNKQVVPWDEVERVTKALKETPAPTVRKRTRLTGFAVATRDDAATGWKLYYSGAHMERDELVFRDKEIPPVPCAKYEFSTGQQRLTALELDVFIDPDYITGADNIHYVGSMGRTIEWRWDTFTVVKIKFFSTGHVKAYGKDMRQPEIVDAGQYVPGSWTKLRIELDWEHQTYSVQIGENKRIDAIPFSSPTDRLNQLFFDGGMHPGACWKVRAVRVLSGAGNDRWTTLPMNREQMRLSMDWAEQLSFDDRAWEKADLPYAIGGIRHKDQLLFLRKVFLVSENKRVFLELDSLDPHGTVFVNGTKVLETDNFMPHKVDITAHVKAGEANLLAVMVYPRAPEMYYYWHRHDDCYHGWFANRIAILETDPVCTIEAPVVRTIKLLRDGKAEVEVEVEVHNDSEEPFIGSFQINYQLWHPVESKQVHGLTEPIRIEGGQKGQLRYRIQMEAKLWEPVTPHLYRFHLLLRDHRQRVIDDEVVVTGIRTVDQTGGYVRLNGKPVLLKGALLMQFLPPYEEVPVNHVCPSSEQIVWQMLMIRRMNGNAARLHQLGYGTNDPRIAEICDQLGIMLFWTTRLIDSLETIVQPGEWRAKEYYGKLVKQVINHPSIIVWEGSNEYHGNLSEIDKMYNSYVDLLQSMDPTRLLSPCSHLYYGGGLYGHLHQYYNDAGTMNQDGQPATSSYGWKSPQVVRSCHPYVLLNGYGSTWEEFRKQDWKWQEDLLQSPDRAYLVTEFAVTGDPNWKLQEGHPWHHLESYEKPYEDGSIGRRLTVEEWRESQAFQGFAAFHAVKKMRILGVDGLFWCCLSEGANSVTYRKPPIDFFGHAKLGFYGLQMGYQDVMACHGNSDVVLGKDDAIHPVILHDSRNRSVSLHIKMLDPNGKLLEEKTYGPLELASNNAMYNAGNRSPDDLRQTWLPSFHPAMPHSGYYTLVFELYEHY